MERHPMYHPRLRRPVEGRLVAGVAAGLADYFDVDVVVVRIALVVLAITGGLGVPLYLAAWLLVPEEGDHEGIAEQFLHARSDADAA